MSLEKQERYSSLVDAKLRYSIIQKNSVVWNTRYEGNPKAGAVKIPVRDTEVSVTEYDKQNGADKTFTNGSFLTVAIDKDYAVNEIIDGYEASAVPDNILADRLDSAGYSLALQMDTDGTEALISGGTPLDVASPTKNNVYDTIVDVRTRLSQNKVPIANRFLIASTSLFALILKSPEFIKASNLGDSVVQNGIVGQIAGFNVIEDATLDGKALFIAGHPEWCARIDEWAVEPHVQSLDGSGSYIGASAVQGRKIYAHKVTKADAVLVGMEA